MDLGARKAKSETPSPASIPPRGQQPDAGISVRPMDFWSVKRPRPLKSQPRSRIGDFISGVAKISRAMDKAGNPSGPRRGKCWHWRATPGSLNTASIMRARGQPILAMTSGASRSRGIRARNHSTSRWRSSSACRWSIAPPPPARKTALMWRGRWLARRYRQGLSDTRRCDAFATTSRGWRVSDKP